MSELAKRAIQDEAQKAKDLQESSQGNFQGGFSELKDGLDNKAGNNGSEDKVAAESTDRQT